MYPISNSNLSAQKHNLESYQLPFVNLIFKTKIPVRLIDTENRPQKKKQYEAEYTPDMQNAEFEEMRRCAYVAA
jgi:hypothetical protein